MKNKKLITIALTILLLLAACSNDPATEQVAAPQDPSTGQIYLYGEQHGVDKILSEELKIWSEYYHNENMRHLFMELPYYTAEFLNIWMQSDSDDILEAIYQDSVGSLAHNPSIKEFYVQIKKEFPETIFHGTDVGHQHSTTGARFLKYLEENGLQDSDQYLLAQEIIEQGEYFYDKSDDAYRENKMTENFIREFDALNNENIMGIYGSVHTGIDAMTYNAAAIPCMANQLSERYGINVNSEDLSWIAKDIEPIRTDTIIVAEKEYTAYNYGKEDLTGFRDYIYREFWQLENAYDDFKDSPKTGDVLPYDNYPMLIEAGQVFVIDYAKTDGSVTRMYYRSDGNIWEGLPTTEEFKAE